MAQTRKKVNRRRRSEPKRILNPSEVAEYCGFGRDYTYRLLREGIIPSLPRGPRGRFHTPVEALDEFLKSVGQKKVA
jgi:excisionase family DNA binding protein